MDEMSAKIPHLIVLLGAVASLALAGCGVFEVGLETVRPPAASATPPQTTEPAVSGTPSPATAPVPAATAGTPGVAVLPAPLYFILAPGGQIWHLEPDAVRLTRITFEPTAVTGFDLSPDGGNLVYVSGNDLIQSDAAGGDRTELVNGPDTFGSEQVNREITNPRWSPDGRQISYTRVGGGKTLVAVLPANGGVARVISGENALSEGNAWSPDGRELVYMTYRSDGGFELWRTQAAAPEHRRLVLSSKELTWPVRWTPDGAQVLLVRGGGQNWYFTALDLASAKEQRIAVETVLAGSSTMTVKMLPEGERYRKLLFPAGMLSAEGEESADFYMIRARDLGVARQLSSGDPGFSWIARASWGGFY